MQTSTVTYAPRLHSSFAGQSQTEIAARPEGRKPNQLRSVDFKRSALSRSDGSIRYTQGGTCVLAAVHGPIAVEGSKEKTDRAVIDIAFKLRSSSATASLQASPREQELAQTLKSTFEAVVATELHPRTKILIAVQVLEEDGALLAAAINAAMLALIDAGVRCNAFVSAVGVALRHGRSRNPFASSDNDSKDTTTASESQTYAMRLPRSEAVLLDPCAREELAAPALATFSFTAAPRTVILEADGSTRYATAEDNADNATASAEGGNASSSSSSSSPTLEGKDANRASTSTSTMPKVSGAVTVEATGVWSHEDFLEAHRQAERAVAALAVMFRNELSA